ncbi:A/G-specific adenine glycosylase [Acinetobacter boissieri]|nr:A/G-specific adenine glycosylase [Acinetobacter boissieri]
MPSFQFSDALLTWFDQHGRHDLPWQVADDPYKVWVSEIMLQQTQVKTVLKYFDRFITRFPNVNSLGQANWDDVAPYWAGLGYYARARNLHKAAIQIVQHGGNFPQTLEGWIELPGIGPSTAGALMSLGLRKYGVILDGNVKRVLARFFAITDDLTKSVHDKNMWHIATKLCPTERNHDYTQAIMDLGATICTPKKPLCLYCPMQPHCQAYTQGTQAYIPFKKPKKAVPERTGFVLCLKQNDDWFWQQRDNTGLWGGLWCLPIFDTEDILTAQLNTMGLTANLSTPLKIKHQFTHFTWHLQAYIVDTTQAQNLNTLQGEWLSQAEAISKGIPTAMQKLIDCYQEQNSC